MFLRLIERDHAYRLFFWTWFAVTLLATVLCVGGNRALPEAGLALSLLLMSVVWAARVAYIGSPTEYGPLTPHLIGMALLLWTAVSIAPLPRDTAAQLSGWQAWGQTLNLEIDDIIRDSVSPGSATLSIDPAASRRELRKLTCYYLFFVLTTIHLRRWRDLRTMLTIIVFIGVLEAVIGSAGTLSGSREYLGVLPDPVRDSHRHFGTFINANHAGTLLGTALVVCLSLALIPQAVRVCSGTPRKSLMRWDFVLLASAGAVLMVGLVLVNSHGAVLATCLPLIALAACLAARIPGAKARLTMMAACALAVGAAAWLVLPREEQALHSAKVLQRRDWLVGERPMLRPTIWRGASAAATVSPWCGSGPGSFIDAYRPFDLTRKETIINSAHNTYLDVLVERGLVGLTLTALGIGWLALRLRSSSKRCRRRHRATEGPSRTWCMRFTIRLGLGGAISVILLHSIVDFPIQIPAIALTFVAFVAAVVREGSGPRPFESISRRRMIVPTMTVIASALLVSSNVKPLVAAGHVGRCVRLQGQIESQIASGREPDRVAVTQALDAAEAVHPFRYHHSRGAAYGLMTRLTAANRSGLDRASNTALLRDAVQMVRTNPFCVEARLAAATAAAYGADAPAALTLARQAEELDVGHAETHYLAGRALLVAGAEQPAVAAFTRSLNASPRFVFEIAACVRSRSLEHEILAQSVDDPRSLCWLAMNLPQTDISTRKGIVAQLEGMLEDNQYAGSNLERLYLRGQIALWLEDQPERAIDLFERSLAIEPLLWIRWHLAQAYRRADRPRAAAGQLEQIAELDPDYRPPDTGLFDVGAAEIGRGRDP